MNQSLWKLIQPDYGSIAKDSIINGFLDHPYGLPGVECERCNQTWGGTKILPYNCPEKFIKKKELKNSWPISGSLHLKLREEMELELEKQKIKINLLPGYDFQPNSLSISGPPKADFLWSNLGSFCVSERIKNIFEENKFVGAVFCPITIKKIGKGKGKLSPMKIKKFESEYELPIDENINTNTQYHEMIITGESKRPFGSDIISECTLCGRQEYDDKKRKIEMKNEMWNGEDIFLLNTTLFKFISNRLKIILENIRASNVWIEQWT